MKTIGIANKVSSTFSKVSLRVKKHSPEILVIAGVVGVVASGVMACVATTKVNKVVDKAKDDIDRIHTSVENGVTPQGESYSVKDSHRDLTIAYIQTGVNFAKLYGPSIILGGLSITSILTSNNILRKRNVALMAAYTAVDKSFKEYRGRVIEKFGEEIDKELKYGIKAKEVTETVIGEDGKEKKVKKTVGVVDPNKISEYAIVFDETCASYDSNPDYNRMFLNSQQQWANDKLKANKHLFLNEIYDELGIKRTPAGSVVGWVYNPDEPNGDNFVEFIIHQTYKEKDGDLVPVTIVDFNVDGIIYNLI